MVSFGLGLVNLVYRFLFQMFKISFQRDDFILIVFYLSCLFYAVILVTHCYIFVTCCYIFFTRCYIFVTSAKILLHACYTFCYLTVTFRVNLLPFCDLLPNCVVFCYNVSNFVTFLLYFQQLLSISNSAFSFTLF